MTNQWQSQLVNSDYVFGSTNVINSQFIHNSKDITDCYTIVGSEQCHNSSFIFDSHCCNSSHHIIFSENCVSSDNIVCSYNIINSQDLWWCTNITNSSQLAYCDNCNNTHFSRVCNNLDNSYFCFNIEKGENLLFNKPVNSDLFSVVTSFYDMIVPKFQFTDWGKPDVFVSYLPQLVGGYSEFIKEYSDQFKKWVTTLPNFDANIAHYLFPKLFE